MRKWCKHCGKTYDSKGKCSCGGGRKAYIKKYNSEHREKLAAINNSKWKRIRKLVIDLDGCMCQRCLIKYGVINVDDLQVHHIKSREHYPELVYDLDNLITVCRYCNLDLGVKDELDFPWSPEERMKKMDYELI